MINRFINFHSSLKVLKKILGFLGESVIVDSTVFNVGKRACRFPCFKLNMKNFDHI